MSVLTAETERDKGHRHAMTEAALDKARQEGHCQRCGKPWTAMQIKAVCQWCGRSSQRVKTRCKGRSEQKRRRKQYHDRPIGEGYSQITPQEGWTATAEGYRWAAVDWSAYYKVAVRFAVKALSGEKDDLLHTIMEALAAVHRRKLATGQPFTEAMMYRIAEHTKDWYWYRHYAYNNGLDCRHCTSEQRARCRHNWASSEWAYCDCHRAIQLESLNEPITDDEGNLTELADLIADDEALDLDEWVDAKTFLIGAPIRLKAIAMKRRDGETLTGADRKYLWKLRKREQLSFVSKG